ncbi:hypothetical protein HPL003_23995 [Paenibacillus terrae HPL-003]|uniref:DUF3102 domain-containing protein n=1 Tax=Paenibacillus terrae (strain HPL-003) TaxID=985665 RepID=G7VSM7_PAETH|nr:DUF3102 domain-containing protein [Paenibacillus terrae]AET61517.1 hypothetical protein HPL003_23995 [Paenibacillus terrae HPL-003]
MSEIATLSSDLPTITAEINAYKRVAGEAIYEIGRRLKSVRDQPQKYGLNGYRDWERWCAEECDMARRSANRFIQAFDELGTTSSRISSSKVFEILQLPSDIDRSSFVSSSHTIPSTGATKTVDEMTVRELREVKAALKAEREARELAEDRAEKAEDDYDVVCDTLEAVRAEPPRVKFPIFS